MTAAVASADEIPLRSRVLVLGTVLSAFGPYVLVSAGLRTEHLLIYSAFPVAILAHALGRPSVLSFGPLRYLLTLLAVVTGWTLVVTIVMAQFVSVQKAVAHLENYVQPIATILVIGGALRVTSEAAVRALLKRSCQLIVWILALNAVVAAASIVYDFTSVLDRFAGAIDGQSVAALARQNGRFLGIFNQPVESGLGYTVGLLAWAYHVRGERRGTLIDFALLGLLLLGGALSISKVFIVGGIPLFLIYWLSLSRIRQLLSPQMLLVGVVVAIGVTQLLIAWRGLRMFVPLVTALLGVGSDPRALLNLVLRGRYTQGGSEISELFRTIWRDAPISGLGFASVTRLDNGYVEFFAQGGLVALLGYLAMLLAIATMALRELRAGTEEGRLLLAVWALIVLAGFGAPVLTINRVSTLIWVLLVLIYGSAFERVRWIGAASLQRRLSLIWRPTLSPRMEH